jgi:hypothetical protein
MHNKKIILKKRWIAMTKNGGAWYQGKNSNYFIKTPKIKGIYIIILFDFYF